MAQFPVPPKDYPTDMVGWTRKIARSVILLMDGKHNATGSKTLTANAATTTLTDMRLTATSVVTFMPKTANAAAALGGLYVTARTNGSCTLNHANNAQADKSFDYTING